MKTINEILEEFEEFMSKYNLPSKVMLMASGFFRTALNQQREEMASVLEKTFDGCTCGFHGYKVLPNCKTEKHWNECARCIIKKLND